MRPPEYGSSPKPTAANGKAPIKYINCLIKTQMLTLAITYKLRLLLFSKGRLICTDLSATTSRLLPIKKGLYMFTLHLVMQCRYAQLPCPGCLKGLAWPYDKVSVASGVLCGEGFTVRSEHRSQMNEACTSSLLPWVSMGC